MAEMIESMEMIFKYLVELCTTGLELAGIIVLVSTAFICFVKWLRRDRENIRLDLAQGIALALEFKMGGEVLRTVVVREMGELLVLGAIILLRAAIARARGRKPVKNTQGKNKPPVNAPKDAETDTENDEDAADYYHEMEMTYEDNFRRPSLGRHTSHNEE